MPILELQIMRAVQEVDPLVVAPVLVNNGAMRQPIRGPLFG